MYRLVFTTRLASRALSVRSLSMRSSTAALNCSSHFNSFSVKCQQQTLSFFVGAAAVAPTVNPPTVELKSDRSFVWPFSSQTRALHRSFAPGASFAHGFGGQMRFIRVQKGDHADRTYTSSSSEDASRKEERASEEDAKAETHEQTEEKSSDKKQSNRTKGEAGSGGFFGNVRALRNDIKDFPDIYNIVNLIHFVIFTIFCLCSTGSNVEEKWWMNNWGIDADFKPWAWFLHSFLTNNFLTVTYAMLMFHSMCVSVLPTIGTRGLMIYWALSSIGSGALMWAYNYYTQNRSEKQFGPWDVVGALLVMQALHQGFMPWQILNAFTSWVKYACWVGAFCIMYYDWQPTVCGVCVGFLLCKLHPRFRNVKVVPGV